MPWWWLAGSTWAFCAIGLFGVERSMPRGFGEPHNRWWSVAAYGVLAGIAPFLVVYLLCCVLGIALKALTRLVFGEPRRRGILGHSLRPDVDFHVDIVAPDYDPFNDPANWVHLQMAKGVKGGGWRYCGPDIPGVDRRTIAIPPHPFRNQKPSTEAPREVPEFFKGLREDQRRRTAASGRPSR